MLICYYTVPCFLVSPSGTSVVQVPMKMRMLVTNATGETNYIYGKGLL